MRWRLMWYVMLCSKAAGRKATLHRAIDFVEEWLSVSEVGTDPIIWTCIIRNAHGRGYTSTMQEICRDMGQQFKTMAIARCNGWRRLRFVEGMSLKKLVCCLQADCTAHTGEGTMALSWARQLVVWLLEVTNGQWIYWISKSLTKNSKAWCAQRIRRCFWEIETKMDMGFGGFWWWIGPWRMYYC